MKSKILITFLLFIEGLNAQQLNNTGHFFRHKEVFPVALKERIISLNPDLNFESKEGEFILTNTGAIYLADDCSGPQSGSFVFDKSGEKVFTIVSSPKINFSFSPDKSFCIFSDLIKIHVVDLTKMNSRTIEGSDVFAIDNSGRVCLYNSKDESVFCKNSSAKVSGRVFKAFIFRGHSLFITSNSILELKENELSNVFTTDNARIFDIAEFDNSLFISVRIRSGSEFIFKSYKSSELKNFEFVEEVKYQLQSTGTNNKKAPDNSGLNSAREMVNNPIDFFSDTVYQPIGNSYGENQNYGSDPYLHPGVDLLGNLAQDVRSVKKGYVKAILTTSGAQHWRTAIANEDTPLPTIGYLYAHLDELSIPYVVGDSVEEGDVIGQLVDFGVPGFNHCHFARVTDSAWFGAWWTIDNPLTFISGFCDSVPPVFEKTIGNDEFAFRDISGNYLSPDSLYGQVRIISKFYDIANSPWQVDVNKIRFNISPLSAPQVMLLDTFSLEFNFYTDVYATGVYTTGVLNTIYSVDTTCFSEGNYNVRNFYHLISSSDGNDTIDGNDSLQFFNTMDFFDGSYILRIIASDAVGNSTTDSMIINFRNNINDIANPQAEPEIRVSPNPSSDGKFNININAFIHELQYDVYDALGKRVKSGLLTSESSSIDLLSKGMYTLRIYDGAKTFCRKLIRS